jgi:hypothetical protein
MVALLMALHCPTLSRPSVTHLDGLFIEIVPPQSNRLAAFADPPKSIHYLSRIFARDALFRTDDGSLLLYMPFRRLKESAI